jgi:hypothetical protein
MATLKANVVPIRKAAPDPGGSGDNRNLENRVTAAVRRLQQTSTEMLYSNLPVKEKDARMVAAMDAYEDEIRRISADAEAEGGTNHLPTGAASRRVDVSPRFVDKGINHLSRDPVIKSDSAFARMMGMAREAQRDDPLRTVAQHFAKIYADPKNRELRDVVKAEEGRRTHFDALAGEFHSERRHLSPERARVDFSQTRTGQAALALDGRQSGHDRLMAMAEAAHEQDPSRTTAQHYAKLYSSSANTELRQVIKREEGRTA